MNYFKNVRVLFSLALALTLTGMLRAEEVPTDKAKVNETTAADIQFFLQHQPSTEQGKTFKESIAAVGRLLKISLTEIPKLAPPNEEEYVRATAPQVVELWAGKYSKYGEKAEKFMVKLLNGFKDDNTGLSISVYLAGAKEALSTVDIAGSDLDNCFKGIKGDCSAK